MKASGSKQNGSLRQRASGLMQNGSLRQRASGLKQNGLPKQRASGSKQSGLPPFKVADLTRDLGLLERARRDASDWIARSPLLAQDGEHLLRRKVLGTYGEALGLGDVG